MHYKVKYFLCLAYTTVTCNGSAQLFFFCDHNVYYDPFMMTQ